MISVFHSGRSFGRRRRYEAALQLTLQQARRSGTPVVEFGPRGAARLELDDFGAVRRIPLTRPN